MFDCSGFPSRSTHTLPRSLTRCSRTTVHVQPFGLISCIKGSRTWTHPFSSPAIIHTPNAWTLHRSPPQDLRSGSGCSPFLRAAAGAPSTRSSDRSSAAPADSRGPAAPQSNPQTRAARSALRHPNRTGGIGACLIPGLPRTTRLVRANRGSAVVRENDCRWRL